MEKLFLNIQRCILANHWQLVHRVLAKNVATCKQTLINHFILEYFYFLWCRLDKIAEAVASAALGTPLAKSSGGAEPPAA
jgi:hypothetical protein